MILYAIASFIYRAFIYIVILLFIGNRLPKELAIVGALFGISALVAWLLVPTGKFIKYLATSGELSRVRARAVLTSLLFFGVIGVGLGAIPLPDRSRVEGVVEPAEMATIFAGEDGLADSYLASGSMVKAESDVLVKESSDELIEQRDELQANLRRLQARRREAQTKEIAAAQALTDQIKAVNDQIARTNEQIARLDVRSPVTGTWVAPTSRR